MYRTISKLVGNSERTISTWKKEGRPIIGLIEKYFTKHDLQEFLRTTRIKRFDNFIDYYEITDANLKKYLAFFLTGRNHDLGLMSFNDFFISYYFNSLVLVGNNNHDVVVKSTFLEEFHKLNLDDGYEIRKCSKYISDMMDYGFFDHLKKLFYILFTNDFMPLMESCKNYDLSNEDDYLFFNEAVFHFISFNIYKYYSEFSERKRNDLIGKLLNEYADIDNADIHLTGDDRKEINLEAYKILHTNIKSHLYKI